MMTDSQANRRADSARNSRFFTASRIAQGRKPEAGDLDENGIAKTPANVFEALRGSGEWSGREGRATAMPTRRGSQPQPTRGLRGGEYGSGYQNRYRKRIGGVTQEQVANTQREKQRENDAFFAMADRARHADPTRPHKTRDAYKAGQQMAGMDTAQDQNLDPKIAEQEAVDKVKLDPKTWLGQATREERARRNDRRIRMAARVRAAESGANEEQQRQQKFSNTSADDISARAKAVIQQRGAIKDGKIDASDPAVHRAMTDSFAAITRREFNKKRS